MCCLHLQAREIIERGHHISVYRVHVSLPYLSTLIKNTPALSIDLVVNISLIVRNIGNLLKKYKVVF